MIYQEQILKYIPPVILKNPVEPAFPRRLIPFGLAALAALLLIGGTVYFAWFQNDAVDERKPPISGLSPIVLVRLNLAEGCLEGSGGKVVNYPCLISPSGETWICRKNARLLMPEKVEIIPASCSFRYTSEGIFLKDGVMLVHVIKIGSPFSMRTPQAVLGVRGTIFSVQVSDKETSVKVSEGKVWLRGTHAAEEREICASQSLSVSAEGVFADPGSYISPAPVVSSLNRISSISSKIVSPRQIVPATLAISITTPSRDVPAHDEAMPPSVSSPADVSPTTAVGSESIEISKDTPSVSSQTTEARDPFSEISP